MANNLESLEIASDNELVALALNNQNDFVYIVNRYEKRLMRYILRLSNLRPEEAQDVLQNIFIKTYINLNDFDDRLKFSSWIYRIAHNEVIDNFRKHQARPQLIDLDISDSQMKDLVAGIDLLEEASLSERAQKIRLAIVSLDMKYQEPLVLKYFEERDYKEIAYIIRKPVGTVASRINKAKVELKKMLGKKELF